MSELLRIRQAVVVEGRYDAIKLADIVDALILTTNGFAIFRDKEQQALLDGRQGETMAKVVKTLVMYGEAFGAERMVPIM